MNAAHGAEAVGVASHVATPVSGLPGALRQRQSTTTRVSHAASVLSVDYAFAKPEATNTETGSEHAQLIRPTKNASAVSRSPMI